MHISDGILSSDVVIATSIISLGLVALSLKNLKNKNIALISAMSAIFFIASFVHIPLGPTQIHLVLIGVIGILLGSGVFLAIAIALLLQATLLGYGGLSSLGANLIIMALPAFLIYLLTKSGILNFLNEKIKYFVIGFLSVFLATIFLCLILVFAKQEYLLAAYTIILANIPAMVIEGLVTLFLINYLKKSVPNILKEAGL
ncbi:cobalt transporter CbiM [Arcobacter arenosus]|uniref:Cobalt transporter CbiM n=1 Tax=Arcobacter arenosus TaxID=2576037 RepID=A0A5R8Y006_9BACT|nr:cobalt transporter CbiM [Arcobacter arenosus]TLP37060.1 cobalt transporter CbiM [Arcobacter arenosus]